MLVSVVPGNVISVPVPLLIIKGVEVLAWVKVKGPSIVADPLISKLLALIYPLALILPDAVISVKGWSILFARI